MSLPSESLKVTVRDYNLCWAALRRLGDGGRDQGLRVHASLKGDDPCTLASKNPIWCTVVCDLTMELLVTLLTVWVGIACDPDDYNHTNKGTQCFEA
jgi:hypothetical protein